MTATPPTPCPFCGHQNVVMHVDERVPDILFFSCPCGALVSFKGHSPDEAFTAYNSRPSSKG